MTATSATSTPSCTAPDLLQVDGDTATIAAPRVCTADVTAGLQLAWGSTPPSQSLLGLRRVDGSWTGAETGWSGATVEARDDEVLANGPVLARLRQTFNLCGGSTVRLTWEVDAASPAIRLDVEVIREVEGELILHLGHVCRPEQAYWRPHSPRSWRGGSRWQSLPADLPGARRRELSRLRRGGRSSHHRRTGDRSVLQLGPRCGVLLDLLGFLFGEPALRRLGETVAHTSVWPAATSAATGGTATDGDRRTHPPAARSTPAVDGRPRSGRPAHAHRGSRW